MKKKVTITILLAIVFSALTACAANTSAETTTTTGTVRVVPVTHQIETSGSLTAARLSQLTWGTSGTVEKINVKVGDKVKEGDVLAELSMESVPADVLTAMASLLSAEQNLDSVSNSKLTYAAAQQAVIEARKNVEEAENTYNALFYPRATDEYIKNVEAQVWKAEDVVSQTYRHWKEEKAKPDGSAEKTEAQIAYTDALLAYNDLVATYNWYTTKPTESDFEEAKIALDVARAELDDARRARDLVKDGQNPATVRSAEATLLALEAQANIIKLIAPFDGEILALMSNIGDTVSTEDLSMVVVDRDTLRVVVQVDESEIGQVQVGNNAQITLDSMDSEPLSGVVSSVNPIGATVSGLVQYDVTISVNPTDQPLLFGATASVNIITQEPTDEIAVPLNAVMNDGVSEYVTVLDPTGNTYYVEVVSGDLVDSYVVIHPLSELSEGATVVIDPNASTSSSSGNSAGGPPDGGFMGPMN